MAKDGPGGLLEALHGSPDAGGADAAAGQFEALLRLAAGYQFREDGVAAHLRRIAAYVRLLAEALGWPADRARLVQHAALFHDVGMVDVPEAVLRKQGALDSRELTLMKRHPELGRALLEPGATPLLAEAAKLAWTHHEAFDGSGYPRGLRGEEIAGGARVLAVADVFDALTTRRSFKDAYPVDVALEILREGAGRRFDPEVVAALLARRGEFEVVAARPVEPDGTGGAGFRISARDETDGDVYRAACAAYFSCPLCGDLHPQDTEICPARRTLLRVIDKLSGRELAEKYQVRGALGVGGMGTVYEMLHVVIGRRLAVKFLDTGLARRPESLARFYKEARLVASVGHPNLVDIMDVAETPEGIPYMVMELLQGRNLTAVLAERGRLSAGAALGVAIEILRTLAAVHAKGIVHRDLKPDNVFLVDDPAGPRLKLLDFGISLLVAPGGRGKRLTQAGDILGTPQYMSPEQAQGKLDVDPRSDLFNVGSILYEMLSGRPVFDGPNPLAILKTVGAGEFEPPGRVVAEIDPDLERAIVRALAWDPADRFPTAEEFLEALVAVGGRVPGFSEDRLDPSLRPDAAGTSAAAAEPSVPPGGWSRGSHASGTRRGWPGPASGES